MVPLLARATQTPRELARVAQPSQVLARASRTSRALTLLHGAGLLVPLRPDRMLAFERDARRWGPMVASVRKIARRAPDSVGLVDELGSLTYAELDRRSDALVAAWLRDGIGPGTCVGLLCRDHRGLVDTLLAASKTGARLLMLNTGFAGPQLQDVVRREGVTVIVHDEEFSEAVAQLPADVERFLAWTDDAAGPAPYTRIEELIANTQVDGLRVPPGPGTIVLLTSGSTGSPKGAPRQVRGTQLVLQMLDKVPWRAGETVLISSPLFHGTGLAHLGLCLTLGSTVVVRRRFDARKALEALESNRCTGMVCVPTMLHRMTALDPGTVAEYDLSRLRIVLSAGSALPPVLVHRVLDSFGEVLYNLYGSTEVSLASVAGPEELRAHPNTAGRALIGCDIRLYDDEGRRITQADRPGRVFVGNGTRFGGYTDGGTKPEIDGLMGTGDTGHFDEAGLLYIDGREDDMVVCGGENVFPAEVENLLWNHEDIAEAAVIGVGHEEFGARLAALVVTEPGRKLTEEAVREHVRARLARHKVPARVLFLDELPRNPTGKLRLADTRRIAREGLES